jgi:5'-deoxynucleotidase YfbR-like HD superfamily hydrolase
MIYYIFFNQNFQKRTFRTGWVLRGVKDAESIADHMYRMSMLAFLAPSHLDRTKF